MWTTPPLTVLLIVSCFGCGGSQHNSRCEELNTCTTNLSLKLSSLPDVLCRAVLDFISCIQGVRNSCPDLDIDKENEFLPLAQKAYNDSNCREVLREITTSTDSITDVPVTATDVTDTSGTTSHAPTTGFKTSRISSVATTGNRKGITFSSTSTRPVTPSAWVQSSLLSRSDITLKATAVDKNSTAESTRTTLSSATTAVTSWVQGRISVPEAGITSTTVHPSSSIKSSTLPFPTAVSSIMKSSNPDRMEQSDSPDFPDMYITSAKTRVIWGTPTTHGSSTIVTTVTPTSSNVDHTRYSLLPTLSKSTSSFLAKLRPSQSSSKVHSTTAGGSESISRKSVTSTTKENLSVTRASTLLQELMPTQSASVTNNLPVDPKATGGNHDFKSSSDFVSPGGLLLVIGILSINLDLV